MIKISVFTPVYNRAYTISKLYESLLNQTVTEFEWIIVNDGSTDNINDLISIWKKDSRRKFNLIYLDELNEGKHISINKGVQESTSELFFIVDSDDYLTNDAIEIILEKRKSITPETHAGLGFCRGYNENTIIGSTFKGDTVDATSLQRRKHNILGDKAEVFFTEILKKYPFPKFQGENFITEATVWYKIANDNYKIRWYQNIIYICNYLEDGLTANKEIGVKNFKGYTHSTKEIVKYNLSWIDKTKMVGSYANAGKKNNITFKKLSENVDVNITYIMFSYSLYKIKQFINP